MSKRGNHEGSVYQRRDGRWVGVVTVNSDDGKQSRKYFYGASRAAVADKIATAVDLLRRGVMPPNERLTVGEYLVRWLSDAVRSSVKESTYHVYAKDVRLHIMPTLATVPMARLTPAQLQRLYRDKLASGLAPTTVLHIHKVLSRALAQALREDLVARNVATLVDPPRVGATNVRAFSIEQARRFVAEVSGSRLEAAFLVALGAGLRRGELLALSWDDVRLEDGHLAVRRSLMKVPGGWQLAEPKNAASRRVVKLPEFAVDALRRHRTRQLEERLAAPVWEDSTLVFTTTIGTPIDGRNFLREFKETAARAGMPAAFTVHSLRHSAATLMLALGVQPKVVQEALGHSRIAVTMDLYSHVLPHLQEEAAAKMDRLLVAR